MLSKIPATGVPGDIWFAQDTTEVFFVLASNVLVNINGLLSGTGAVGPKGDTGAQGPVGPAYVPSVVEKTGDYTTSVDDDIVLANFSAPHTITLITSGIPAGKKYTVTVIGAAKATVVPQSGPINGESDAVLFEGDSLDLLWDGANFFVQ